MVIRSIADRDFEALARLITSEAAQAQPACTPGMIQATLHREADVDQGF